MDELNRLLIASQGVASSLTMQNALQPVLEALVGSGASSARVVLTRDFLPNLVVESASRFAQGSEQNAYVHLDQQILALPNNKGES